MIMDWLVTVGTFDSHTRLILLANGIRPQGWPREESRGSGWISSFRYPNAGSTRLYKSKKSLGNFVANWSKEFGIHSFQESTRVSLSHSQRLGGEWRCAAPDLGSSTRPCHCHDHELGSYSFCNRQGCGHRRPRDCRNGCRTRGSHAWIRCLVMRLRFEKWRG